MFSVTPQQQADELDIVVIGPPGLKLIEVKHWNTQWMDKNADIVKREANRLSFKARKIGTTLRRNFPNLGHVEGAFLITGELLDDKKLKALRVGGASFHILGDGSFIGAPGFHGDTKQTRFAVRIAKKP